MRPKVLLLAAYRTLASILLLSYCGRALDVLYEGEATSIRSSNIAVDKVPRTLEFCPF